MLAHLLLSLPSVCAYLLVCRGSGASQFTLHENEIQSTKYFVRNYQRIMQNKPNFGKAQMNVNIYYIKDYQIFIPLAGQKNKPNSNPIKPNFQKAKMNIYSFTTKDYRKNDDYKSRYILLQSGQIASQISGISYNGCGQIFRQTF